MRKHLNCQVNMDGIEGNARNDISYTCLRMKQYFALLDRVIGDSKTLSKREFEKMYKGKAIEIILNAPIIFNDSISLYRGRLAEDIGDSEDLSKPATFSYVPLALNEKGIPKMGRANYKGQSIFYASERMGTNFKEISKDSNIGDEAYLAKWVLKPNSNLHLYRAIPDWGISEANDPISPFTITQPEIVNSELGLYLKRLGYIMMSNEEIGKYLGSSYLANCIYTATGVVKDSKGNTVFNDIHYDGIAYPCAIGNPNEVNIALKPEFVDNNLKLECVIKGHLAPDMRSVEYEKIGINENGRIVWYTSIIDENSITILDAKYFDYNGNFVDVSKGQILDADNKAVKSELTPFTQAIVYHRKEMFLNLANLVQMRINESQAVRKSSLEKCVGLDIIREFDGWKLNDNHKSTPLSKAVYTIKLKNQLKEISPDNVR